MEGVEPTHPYGYQILSLARLPIPPHRLPNTYHSGKQVQVDAKVLPILLFEQVNETRVPAC